MGPTVQSSTSGVAYERETPYQQRGFTNSTFAGAVAYTQYRAAEVVDPGHRRPSTDITSVSRSNREDQDLLSVGSQAFNTGNAQFEPRMARVEEAFACPYHGPILQERLANYCSGQGLGPMDRYLAEGPSEQCAIFYRPDTGVMSTHKGCKCIEMVQSGIDNDDYAKK